jgi:hypothetical protein
MAVIWTKFSQEEVRIRGVKHILKRRIGQSDTQPRCQTQPQSTGSAGLSRSQGANFDRYSHSARDPLKYSASDGEMTVLPPNLSWQIADSST